MKRQIRFEILKQMYNEIYEENDDDPNVIDLVMLQGLGLMIGAIQDENYKEYIDYMHIYISKKAGEEKLDNDALLN